MRPAPRSSVWTAPLVVVLLASSLRAWALDLSVVVCGRNDGHGTDYSGDFVSRLRKTVVSMLHNLCARSSSVSSEIVVVDWRPPNTSQSLRRLVQDWIVQDFVERSNEFNCRIDLLPLVRVISVQDVHADAALQGIGQTIRGGMLEWYCKNIGLRRAFGDMLLTINADDIFSPALFDFIAQAPLLRRDTFYLAQNVGIYFTLKADRPHYAMYEELFKAAKMFAMKEIAELVNQKRPEVEFSKRYNFCERPEQLWGIFHQHAAPVLQRYDEECGIKVNDSSQPGMPRNFYDLYVGDFMMASRVAWQRINGAPLILQSIAIDWLVSCRFTALGLRQVVLTSPCYVAHQNHPHSMTLKKRRVDRAPEWGGGIDSWEHCKRPLRSLRSESGVLRRQWGFSKYAFPEVHFVVREGQLAVDVPAQ